MTEQLEAWPAGQTATMNVTYTQANAAGGAVVCEITPGAGNEFIVLSVRQVNSGTNSCNVQTETVAGGVNLATIGFAASGAGTNLSLTVGTTGTGGSSGNVAGMGYPLIVSGTQALKVAQAGAGAQNDTMQVLVNIRVKTGAMPTVIHSNSTNQANVTVTSGAESFTVV